MPGISHLLIALHGLVGDGWFLAVSAVVGLLLAFVAIPRATDLMVNCAAGLAGRYFGKGSRTLVINASTNNPEAASMVVSFTLMRFGGWANPLGSLLANIYLLYGVSVVWVGLKFAARRDWTRLRALLRIMWDERRLAAVHIGLSVLMFVFGYFALRVVLAQGGDGPVLGLAIAAGAGLLALGIVAFIVIEAVLKRRRPELFEDMDATDHRESWGGFLAGTLGVVGACWIMNEFFLAWTDVYGAPLGRLFGPMAFAWLHWIVGALITSLPELNVAVKNLEKLKAPELNTALGSVSYSNFVNLAIALVGLGVWAGLAWLGVSFLW